MLKAILIVAVVVYLFGVAINMRDIVLYHEIITSDVEKDKDYQILSLIHISEPTRPY